MMGRERRWVDPRWGLVKLSERSLDHFASREIFPHFAGVLSAPYSWLLPRRFHLVEGRVAPPSWPPELSGLRILHLSDLHTGPFLRPGVIGPIFRALLDLRPDVVAITGDSITGDPTDLDPFLEELAILSTARFGAFFCLGNHDHYTAEPEAVLDRFDSIGIRPLRNEIVEVAIEGAWLRIAGIDDRLLGAPDWDSVVGGTDGPPHLLLAHNPDDFYHAADRGITLVLAGHTHAGQIRVPGGPPIIRQSRYCLDEGLYEYGEARLVVSAGFGAIGLPWRFGADPEAVWLEIGPAGVSVSR